MGKRWGKTDLFMDWLIRLITTLLSTRLQLRCDSRSSALHTQTGRLTAMIWTLDTWACFVVCSRSCDAASVASSHFALLAELLVLQECFVFSHKKLHCTLAHGHTETQTHRETDRHRQTDSWQVREWLGYLYARIVGRPLMASPMEE